MLHLLNSRSNWLILAICFCGFLSVHAQSPNLDWVNSLLSAATHGGEAQGKAIALDVKGNVYVVGYFNGGIDFNPAPSQTTIRYANGEEDIFVAKYTAKGKFVWVNTVGSPARDEGLGLAIDNAGMLYITGYFSGKMSFDPTVDSTTLEVKGGEDAFIVRYNSEGIYKGAIAMGGTANDRGTAIAINGGSDIYITGSFENEASFNPEAEETITAKGGADIFIAKYSSSGTYSWAFGIGSEENDYGNAIALDGTGDVYIAGKLKGTANFNPKEEALLSSAGASDIFLAKYNYNGDYEWAYRMGGNEEDEATAITVDIRGNTYITGSFMGKANFNPAGEASLQAKGKRDAFIARYNSRGEFSWANRLGGIGEDFGSAVEIVGRNEVAITGSFINEADLAPASTQTLRSKGDVLDVFFVKYDTEGKFIWANRLGGRYSEYVNALALDRLGNVYMTGSFEGQADFDPSDKKALLNTNAIQTLFVAQYDAETAGYNYAFAVGYRYDASLSKIKSIKTDQNKDIIIAGYFEGAVNFNPEGKTILTTAGRWSDAFVAKYDSNGVFKWVQQYGAEGKDICNDMDVDAQGNIYFTGYFEGTPKFGNQQLQSNGDYDAYVGKLSKEGQLEWVRSYGSMGKDQGQAIATGNTGEFYLAGLFEGKVNFQHNGQRILDTDQAVFLGAYRDNGSLRWLTSLEASTTLDMGVAMTVDASNNPVVVGHFSGLAAFDAARRSTLRSMGGDDAFVVKYSNNAGLVLWSKRMGGNKDDRAVDVAIGPEGQVLVTGRFKGSASFGTNTLRVKGAEDAFLAQFSSAGDFSWVRRLGGGSHEEGLALATNKKAIYVSGYFQGTTYFDVEEKISINSMTIINSDIFIAKYDYEGSCAWAQELGGVATDIGTAMLVTAEGSLYLGATFQEKVDFNPGEAENIVENYAITSAAAIVKFRDYDFSVIEYLKFDASRLNEDKVSLTWTTASEVNNAGFEVERKLEGADEFAKVGYIYGFGTTNEPTNYRFTDMNAFDGLSYYRFRQLDFSGQGTYSKVLTVEGLPSASKGKITLYPLPVTTELKIRFGQMPEDARTLNLSIINSRGKVVHEFTAAVSSNELLEIEAVEELDRGRYLVQIEYNNGNKTTQEFVKE